MKNCDDIGKLLSPYLEEEVSPREREKIEAHLEGCESCRTDLALLRQTVAALRSVPELPAPAAILAGIRQETSPAPKKGFFRRFFGVSSWVGAPIGALAMAVLAIGVFVLQERYPELGEAPDPNAPRPTATSAPVEAEEQKDRPMEKPAAEKLHPVGEKTSFFPADAVRDLRQEPLSLPEGYLSPPVAGPAPSPAASPSPPAAPAPTPAKPDDSGVEVLAEEAGEIVTDAASPGPVAGPVKSPKRLPPPRESAGPGEDKSVTRLLENNEFAAPGRRDRIGAPLSITGDTASEPVGKEASQALPPDRDDLAGKGPFPSADENVTARQQVKKKESRGSLFRSEFETAAQEDRPQESQTEVLTVLALRGDEMAFVRRSIRAAGGQLLEMKSLDAFRSQQVAQPFQERIPASQVISRGWQVRALLPVEQVKSFVASLEKDSRLRLLSRTQVPTARQPAPGTQSIEIHLVR